MDPRFYVVREERCRVTVKRYVPPQLEDPVRLRVMELPAEHFHRNMAARYHDLDVEDHRPSNFFPMRSDETSYGGGWHTMNVMKITGHGKQLPVLEPTPNVSVRTYQRPPVATQVQYQHPIVQNQQASLLYHHDQQASQTPHPVKKPAPGTVIDSNEAARIYGGVVIRDQAPPQVKNPAPGTVIDSNEAARIYGGVVIKDFSRNIKLPSVRAF